MNKELWKKIYGQCRMWVNAREITLDPVPRTVDLEDENCTFLAYWAEEKEIYRVVVHAGVLNGKAWASIELSRMWCPTANEIIVRRVF